MPLSLALHPELNLRVHSAGLPASLAAAAAWLDGWDAGELAARTVLLDQIAPDWAEDLRGAAEKSGVACCWRACRYRLDGSPAQLFDLAGMLLGTDSSELAAELRAAVSAHEAALRPRNPTLVMGIVNVTPDSFSDGGQWNDPGAAVAHGLALVQQGAAVLDVGGESTRPGAAEVPEAEELRRVLPVVERLREESNALISIDTRKSAVAAACLDAGADWVNDVSGFTHDAQMAQVVARFPGTRAVLMHSRARPADERYSTQYDEAGTPVYGDVVADTMRWLRAQMRVAMDAGIPAENLWIDPGFGFGKSFEQNIELLRRLREYTSIGAPVLLGTSRKSSVGRLLGNLPVEERLEGTLATVAWGIAQGAAAVRVHDVREAARVARVADALRSH